jgi:hypothetical protein
VEPNTELPDVENKNIVDKSQTFTARKEFTNKEKGKVKMDPMSD